MSIRKKQRFILFSFVILTLSGCVTSSGGNLGQLQSYTYPTWESDWIINGEPIQFEGAMWYPQDGTENFLDSEVALLGEYRNVQFFADRQDVRPYERLYTKFNRNQYRYFEQRKGE